MMAIRVLFHLAVPPSPMAACDAVVQDVESLRKRIGGEVCHLYPGRAPGTRFPRRWWGLHRLIELRRAERRIDVHHVFNPDPFPFDVLRFLQRPIVYTAVAGVGGANRDAAQRLAGRVHTLAVPTQSDADRLLAWGVSNVVVTGPGIDVSHFTFASPPADAPLTVLMGSAPWTRDQFQSKGVDALLEAAQRRPDMRLIFLWRGLLAEEMARRVSAAGVRDRVEVLNEVVDVNRVLARAHASVALASDPSIIKAYPHSLLESLAAGKPVLVSRLIPMADYVAQHNCGCVVEQVDAESILEALRRLEQDYAAYQPAALRVGRAGFASPADVYEPVYARALRH